jgi:serine/threonine protein kinase
MLAGKLPFYDKVMTHLFKKIQTGSYSIPEFFSTDVINLLKKMICVDPNKRATVDDVILDPWFRINWDDDLLNFGELVRTPSQEQINETINQLREQRKKSEVERPASASATSSHAAPKPKKPRGQVDDGASTSSAASSAPSADERVKKGLSKSEIEHQMEEQKMAALSVSGPSS